MKIFINILLSIFLSANCFAQDTIMIINDSGFDDTFFAEEDTVYISVEQMPEYPGGELAMRKFIADNLVYPQQALECDVQGTVHLRFVVTKTGEIGKVEVIRGVDPLYDKEAVRVVKLLKGFKPGMQNEEAVNVWFSVPIVFKINN